MPIDPKHVHGDDLTGDAYLDALADLYLAARTARAMAHLLDSHRRLDFRKEGMSAARTIGDAATAALQSIDDYMRLHRQPVVFVHRATGDVYTIPSQGRRVYINANHDRMK